MTLHCDCERSSYIAVPSTVYPVFHFPFPRYSPIQVSLVVEIFSIYY